MAERLQKKPSKKVKESLVSEKERGFSFLTNARRVITKQPFGRHLDLRTLSLDEVKNGLASGELDGLVVLD